MRIANENGDSITLCTIDLKYGIIICLDICTSEKIINNGLKGIGETNTSLTYWQNNFKGEKEMDLLAKSSFA